MARIPLKELLTRADEIGRELRRKSTGPRDPALVGQLLALLTCSRLSAEVFAHRTETVSASTLNLWRRGRTTTHRAWPEVTEAFSKALKELRTKLEASPPAEAVPAALPASSPIAAKPESPLPKVELAREVSVIKWRDVNGVDHGCSAEAEFASRESLQRVAATPIVEYLVRTCELEGMHEKLLDALASRNVTKAMTEFNRVMQAIA